jgi:hypothetical protein
VQQCKAERQQRCASAIGEEAEVTNTHEAAWQHMKEKAPQELIDGQDHQPLLIAMSGVAPAECDVAVFESHESVVGDGHAVGVGTEIAQCVFGAAEGSFGVDNPVMAEQSAQPPGEGTRFSQVQIRRTCSSHFSVPIPLVRPKPR